MRWLPSVKPPVPLRHHDARFLGVRFLNPQRRRRSLRWNLVPGVAEKFGPFLQAVFADAASRLRRGEAPAKAQAGTVRADDPYNLGMVPTEKHLGHSGAGRCQLCGRLLGEDRLTRHHLLPRSRSKKMKHRRKGRQKLKRRDSGRTVALCGPCHRNVHVSIGNTDLARGYDSVEALRDHPGVRRFTEWVKDKPHGRA